MHNRFETLSSCAKTLFLIFVSHAVLSRTDKQLLWFFASFVRYFYINCDLYWLYKYSVWWIFSISRSRSSQIGMVNMVEQRIFFLKLYLWSTTEFIQSFLGASEQSTYVFSKSFKMKRCFWIGKVSFMRSWQWFTNMHKYSQFIVKYLPKTDPFFSVLSP